MSMVELERVFREETDEDTIWEAVELFLSTEEEE